MVLSSHLLLIKLLKLTRLFFEIVLELVFDTELLKNRLYKSVFDIPTFQVILTVPKTLCGIIMAPNQHDCNKKFFENYNA